MKDWSKPKVTNNRDWSIPKDEWLAQQQSEVPSKKENPGLFMQGVDKINELGDVYAAPIAAGAIENAMFLPTLVGNVGRNLIGKESVPYANLEAYLKPEASRLNYNVAKYGPAVAGFGKLGAQGISSLANQENLLGALIRGFSNKKTGESVVKGYEKSLANAKENFSNVFREAEQGGLTNIPFNINPKDRRILERAIGKPALEKALENPTPENLHYLRSNLQSWARDIKSLGASAHPSDKAMLGTIEKYVSESKNLLHKELEGLSPELLQKYFSAKQNYKQNVTPFQNVGGRFIEKAAQKPGSEGYVSPSRIPEKMQTQSGDPFRSSEKMKEYPELKVNQKFKALTKPTIGTAGTLYLLHHLFKGHD